MNKPRRLSLILCGLLVVSALALWPGTASLRAYANVTLVSFTANSLPGQPEIYLEWETATEFDTVGFFITRSDSFSGAFTRVSDFIPHEGDTVVGAQYDWLDEDTVLSRVYLYKLEEITSNQQSEFYGPITITAGIPATAVPPPATHTPTATSTRTPTSTPSPTATSVTQSNTTAGTTSSNNVVVATPRVVVGATVTPRPTSSGRSSSPAVAATPVANEPDSPQQPQTVATALPSVPDVAAVTVAPQLPAAVEVVAQAPDPTLAPADAVPAIVAPAIVVTEAAPVTAATDSANGSALLLVAAAILFLGIAFVILRQVRQ